MLGAEFEARSGDKRGGRKLTLRQHYWKRDPESECQPKHGTMSGERWRETKKPGKKRPK